MDKKYEDYQADIKKVGDCYILYINGSFVSSCDTYRECAEDLREYLKNKK